MPKQFATSSNCSRPNNQSRIAAHLNDPFNTFHHADVAKENYPFNDDLFVPIPTKRDGKPITHNNSAILDPSVARGLIDTSMLPIDECLYDWLGDTCIILDKAKQCSFEMQDLIRRVEVIHL